MEQAPELEMTKNMDKAGFAADSSSRPEIVEVDRSSSPPPSLHESARDSTASAAADSEIEEEKERSEEEEKNEEFISPAEQVREPSVEELFRDLEVPSWWHPLTLRAFVASLFLSVVFTTMVFKFIFSTGLSPSLNVSAGFLGYILVQSWTRLLDKFGLLRQPFTRQENTIIQTCVVTSASIAFNGGFGTYLFAMSAQISRQISGHDRAANVVDLHPSWIIAFLSVVSFTGLPIVVALRKFMITKSNLSYPSGTTTAHQINSLHTPQGSNLTKKQILRLGIFFGISFLFACFGWFFSAGVGCGFKYIPTFGLAAYRHKFYFDFSLPYVGVGMINPYMTSLSLLLGALVSWGLMWPLIASKKGKWYAANLADNSFQGLQAYKVFIAISMILGDGLFNLLVPFYDIARSLYNQSKKTSTDLLPSRSAHPPVGPALAYDDEVRTRHFLKDPIPTRLTVLSFIVAAVACILGLPLIYVQVRWYYIISLFIIGPVLAFCNAYGCGLTDWSLAATYSRLVVFIFAAWAGSHNGGVIVGLAACGVVMNMVSNAADLMQDLKTSYMTLTPPRSMLAAQTIGNCMGCVISSLVFWVFTRAFPDLGVIGSEYSAPNAMIYRNMAIIGVQGFDALPEHCLSLCFAGFAAVVVMNLAREVGKRYNRSWAKYIPSPMTMAIPFYIGGYFTLDMWLGALIVFLWNRRWKANKEKYSTAVATGLISGDGVWIVLSSLIVLFGAKPPVCLNLARG